MAAALKPETATNSQKYNLKRGKKMKLTKKQIDVIIKNTPENLRGTFPRVYDELGMFSKQDANWAYHAVYTDTGALVVTVYGQVV